MIKKIFIKSRS